MGDRYIRGLQVVGMMSRMRQIIKSPERYDSWFADTLAREPGKVAAVAMTNKTARMVWAAMTRNETYQLYHKDSSVIRLRPTHPNHIWAIDFVHD